MRIDGSKNPLAIISIINRGSTTFLVGFTTWMSTFDESTEYSISYWIK